MLEVKLFVAHTSKSHLRSSEVTNRFANNVLSKMDRNVVSMRSSRQGTSTEI